MKSPLDDGYSWLLLHEVTSTQDVAADALLHNKPPGIVLAKHQTQGRGRHGRVWMSSPDDSLTMSLLFRPYANCNSPHLIGMAVSIAAAMSIHCQLQWPNDLVIRGKKVGGIITELKPDHLGRLVPIVGLGINLNQDSFHPSIVDRATSLAISFGGHFEPETIATKVIDHLAALPEPKNWSDLHEIWNLFDQTAGKRYSLGPDQTAIAIGIGSSGELICTVDGEARSVVAADAIFGTSTA